VGWGACFGERRECGGRAGGGRGGQGCATHVRLRGRRGPPGHVVALTTRRWSGCRASSWGSLRVARGGWSGGPPQCARGGKCGGLRPPPPRAIIGLPNGRTRTVNGAGIGGAVQRDGDGRGAAAAAGRAPCTAAHPRPPSRWPGLLPPVPPGGPVFWPRADEAQSAARSSATRARLMMAVWWAVWLGCASGARHSGAGLDTGPRRGCVL
jgi:hypothetical protein